MSESRMMRRTDAIVLTILCSVLVGVIGVVIGFKLALPAGKAAQPPVIVVGGSIYGDASGGSGTWYPASQCNQNVTVSNEYCASVNNDSYILSSKLYNPSLAPNLSANNIWKIHITDMMPDGKTEDTNGGILICNYWQCDQNTAPIYDSNHIYIVAFDPNDSVWTNASSYLYYQDVSGSCRSSYNPRKHEGNCEHPIHAILFVNGAQQPTSTSECQSKGCKIGVGNPAYSSH